MSKKFIKTGEALDILYSRGEGDVRAFMKGSTQFLERTDEGIVWGTTGLVAIADPYTMARLWEIVEMERAEQVQLPPDVLGNGTALAVDELVLC